MNELNLTKSQKKCEIINTKNRINTTKATLNLPSSPKLWKQNRYDLGILSKKQLKTKYNLDTNQSPIRMVDYTPSIITIPTYKLSTQSTISNITSEK